MGKEFNDLQIVKAEVIKKKKCWRGNKYLYWTNTYLEVQNPISFSSNDHILVKQHKRYKRNVWSYKVKSRN